MNYEKYINVATKNILDFYKYKPDHFYLIKNFTDTNQIGTNVPNKNNPYARRNEINQSHIQVVDEDNDYYINELGFRGKINYDSEILAAGCVITFGLGVPEEATWSQILSKKINMDIVNLGNPGVPVKKICEMIIKYACKYKMPKTIFVLFPSFFRGMLLEDVDFYSSTKNMYPVVQRKLWKQENFDTNIFFNKDKNFVSFKYTSKPRYFKSKDQEINYMENVFSPHQLILDSIESILILEYFCFSHNINLYWTTPDPATAMLMDTLLKIPNFKLKKYFNFDTENFEDNFDINGDFIKESCSLSHDSKFLNHPSWKRGSDKCLDINNNELKSWVKSPGIHYHHHVAELFYKVYNHNIGL
jgi:hypothetical protein